MTMQRLLAFIFCLMFMFGCEGVNPVDDPIFRLIQGSADVGAEGGTVSVTVQQNVEYECTFVADWIREAETKSYDENTHIFEVLKNTSGDPRTATISFCGNNTCVPFIVSQSGAGQVEEPAPDPAPEVYLRVDKTDAFVLAEGSFEQITINVTSNGGWSVESDCEWCTVSTLSGENDGSFSISVSENNEVDPRIANIIVSSVDGTVTAAVTVVQSAMLPKEESDTWKTSEFSHKSLALRFTADWCGYCPMMATAMEKAQEMLPDKLEVLSVHGSGSGLASSASIALADGYGIRSFPTGLVDNRIYIENYGASATASYVVEAVEDTEDSYDTVTGLSWTSTISRKKVYLNLAAYIKEAGSYKINAFLVEDNIIGYQADYTHGNSYTYEHNSVLRVALSDVMGDSFTVEDDCQVIGFEYSASLPTKCDVENMRVVVFIQRLDVAKDSYYVDNCATAAVGKTKSLSCP